MRHIKLTLEYDGTNYAGWQSQINGIAIQDLVAKAIEKMVEEKVVLRGASRSDAGVHALGQVAAFQTTRDIPCEGFLKGLNSLLPPDIRVVDLEEVSPAFHPIKDAKAKHYQYILEMGKVPSALLRNRVWWVGVELDVGAMKRASHCLIGEHDFKSFQGALSDVTTTVRCLKTIHIECHIEYQTEQAEFQTDELGFPIISTGYMAKNLLRLTFVGDGFLKYMVRNIVGTLVEVGQGRRPIEDMEKILKARDRRLAGPTAPPQGLYLLKVDY